MSARWRFSARGRDGRWHDVVVVEADTRRAALDVLRRSPQRWYLAFRAADQKLERADGQPLRKEGAS